MTPLEKILGLSCMLKERMPFDKCIVCSGYRSEAKAMGCFDYLPRIDHQAVGIETIRDLNDQTAYCEGGE